MKRIELTDEQYNRLIRELVDGESHRHNSDSFHADDVPSKVLPVLESKAEPLDNDQVISRLLIQAKDALNDAEDMLRVNREQVCIQSAFDENPGKPIPCPDLDDALVLVRSAYDLTSLAAKKWYHP